MLVGVLQNIRIIQITAGIGASSRDASGLRLTLEE